MTLYLYKTGTAVPVLTIENAVSYTDNRAVTEDVELSSLEDCSEALRAKWRREHPGAEVRVDELEAVLADYTKLTDEDRETVRAVCGGEAQ